MDKRFELVIDVGGVVTRTDLPLTRPVEIRVEWREVGIMRVVERRTLYIDIVDDRIHPMV